MGSLEIRLLGGLELSREGRLLEQLPLRAARSLFAYLVLNRERAHTRDLLAGTFWPDFDEARARRRLSQALWQVQASIGETDGHRYLIGTPDTVRFNADADFWLDVDEFEALLSVEGDDRAEESEALGAAVDLYRGDLLAGFYDDWLLPAQDRLRSRFLGALQRLSDLAMARGDYETALIHARRLVQEDEFDEEAHRRVMRIAVLLGRHNEALRQFEECRRILEEELGSAPSAETVELYEATLADREVGGRAPRPHEESPLFGDGELLPFVGRTTERTRFAQRLDEILEGRGGVVLVEGESGVGKTRLLTEVAEDARWRGMDVLWGRSSSSGGRPFAALAEALDGVTGLRARQLASRLDPLWAGALAPLAPGLVEASGDVPTPGPVRRADEQHRMREAIASAFQGIASLAPTLVVLEDLHWADDDTIQALTHLATRIDSDRVLLAVSYRHGEAREREDVWQLLRDLDRLAHCERISLAPYSPAQTEELIRKSLGLVEVSGDFSERLHRDTGGLPLFIVETLRALYEKDDLAEAEAPAEEAPSTRDRLPVTPTVHALIRHRLDGLEPSSRKTLELVAAHDGGLLLEEVVGASELDDQAVLAALDDLVRRRLLLSRQGDFEVEHDLMRRVVYEDLSLSRRLDLHRRVALAIEKIRPDEVEMLAHHFTAARIPDRAAEYLERAAANAMAVHAYDTAATHLERASAALAEIAAPDARQFAVASLLEEVLDVLGRREEQEDALRRMERHAGEADRGDVHRRRAWWLWLAHQDRFAEAKEEARLALEMARASGDGGKVVAALSTLGMIACLGGRAAEGVQFLEEAADFRGADRRQEADARNALGQNLIDLQRFGEAESQLLAALALYGELGDARGEAEVLGMLGTLRMERGEPESAETDFLKAIEISQRIGYRHGEAVNQANLAILYVITNRLGSAIRSFDAAAETYGLMGNRRGLAQVQSNAAWMRHSRLGQSDEAARHLEEALNVYREIGDTRGKAQCLAIVGSIRARKGTYEAAWEAFRRGLDLAMTAEDQWLSAQILREYGSAELGAGNAQNALIRASQAEALCEKTGMDDLIIGVRALKGRALLELGRPEEAVAETAKAVKTLRPGMEFAHLVHFSHGLVLEELGEHSAAYAQFERAYKMLLDSVADLGPDDREQALLVEDHAGIIDWWRTTQPQVSEHLIASIDAPTGRAVTPDECVKVRWTVHDPSDLEVKDRAERRRHRLLRLLVEARTQRAAPTVRDLAAALGVGDATVRRDLALLRAGGVMVTTRGSRDTTLSN